MPEHVIRQGDLAEEIFKTIHKDDDDAILVLAAGISKEAPDRYENAGDYATIVPGHLDDEDLHALS